MDSTTIIASLRQAVSDAELESAPSVDLQATIYVPRDHVPAVARALRDRPDLRFDVLVELTAVDFWPREPRFELIYILLSTGGLHRVRLKVRLHGQDSRISSVSAVWPAANWLEREVWDLFGITFDDHPDLRRLLMPDDWEGHPLRRDYPVQVRVPVRTTEPLQVSEAEFRASIERDRLIRQP